jgi:hypothetical protein
VRWFKLGGENTKFFHSKATERYRFHKIAEIQDADGNVLSDHQDKANAFWLSYKGRMGVCVPTNSSFVLSDILHPADDLASLITPFSEKEISDIVKYMKPDRAPGLMALMASFSRNAGILSRTILFIYAMNSMLEMGSFRVSMALSSL